MSRPLSAVTRNDFHTAAGQLTWIMLEAEQPEVESTGLSEFSGCTGLHQRAASSDEGVVRNHFVGIPQLLD